MRLLLFILCLPIITARSPSIPPTEIQLGHNTFGAVLFFSYIFAALYFTSYIVLSISKPPTQTLNRSKSTQGAGSPHNRKAPRQAGWIWHHGAFATFCALSLASFAVLSWNMLNFLVISYLEWSAKHQVSTPVGLHGLTLLKQRIQYVWLWATGSDLFQTFAEDLISDPARWKVVRVALIYSYSWNSWMSTLGESYPCP
ncbi:hypothetical protein ES702_03555 [subsurface metagenome]